MENTTNLRSTPKDFFLHLLNIIIFYLAVVNFITLFIQYITVLFPDPLEFYYGGITGAVRTSMAILFVAVPVYIITSRMLGKDLKFEPGKRELKLRKWLIYLTLFLAAITIIVDLIIFINSFLGGGLTAQFFFKVLLVMIVAGAIFAYYMWDLKRKDKETSRVPTTLAWIVSLVVLASIILGFFIIGTPGQQRDRKADEQRISDLQQIQFQIVNYWDQKDVLPQNLNLLGDSISGYVIPLDPETNNPYEYTVKGDLSFELCATFNTSSDDFGIIPVPTDPYSYRGLAGKPNWQHEAGRACFERTIDPDLYNSNPGQLKASID